MSQGNVGYAYTSCYALIRSLALWTFELLFLGANYHFGTLHASFLPAQETFQKWVFLNNFKPVAQRSCSGAYLAYSRVVGLSVQRFS